MNESTIVMNSLEAGDAQAAAVQKTPYRVTLESMKGKIKSEQFFHPEAAVHVTICALTLVNGFVLIGQSAPADPANFDKDLGHEFARNDAIRQMWPLEGYLLRDRLTSEIEVHHHE